MSERCLHPPFSNLPSVRRPCLFEEGLEGIGVHVGVMITVVAVLAKEKEKRGPFSKMIGVDVNEMGKENVPATTPFRGVLSPCTLPFRNSFPRLRIRGWIPA